MDVIRIPDVCRILYMSLQTIDTFSTWSEDLEVRLNCKTTDFPIKKIEYTMKKLAKYKLSTVIPKVNTLFYLLTETILNVVGSQETLHSSSKKSFSQMIRNKIQKLTSTSGSILPIPTFDEVTICQQSRDMKQLYKLVEKHKKIYRELQKQQEVCWIAKSKVTKYELCLLTAMKSRSYMSDKLPAKELKSRDEAIEQLQHILELKVKKAADASHKYKILLDRERLTRSSMKQMESKVMDALMFGLTEKVITGLSSLQNILTSKCIQRSAMLLSHIQRFKSDGRCFVSSIIDSLSAEYKCCSPQEYHEQKGFNERLPNYSFNKAILHQKLNEEQHSANNNNENSDSLDCNFISNKRLEIKKLEVNPVLHSTRLSTGKYITISFNNQEVGSRVSIVKQKIATESSSLVFGWCRSKPWNQKRWGFFNKDISSE